MNKQVENFQMLFTCDNVLRGPNTFEYILLTAIACFITDADLMLQQRQAEWEKVLMF
jgi:hypothetical protein